MDDVAGNISKKDEEEEEEEHDDDEEEEEADGRRRRRRRRMRMRSNSAKPYHEEQRDALGAEVYGEEVAEVVDGADHAAQRL